jgi:aminomethyltransferase
MAVSSADNLQQTPLYNLHGELNARMVPFAGYSMPVQYTGVKAEHLHTREMAGLFDVSHMGQVLVRGDQAAQQLEALVPVDLVDLSINKQIYSLLTNDEGGIIDDLMICRWDEETFFLVVNAACKENDLTLLEAQLEGLTVELLDDKALVALQGPKAVSVITTIFPESQALTFMTGCHADFEGNPVYITRAGYTGEDGFEISLPDISADGFCRKLLEFEQVAPVGLGARDTLRLEAGLCLYGHDMNESITPVTADLQWSISKARRKGGARVGGFTGADVILDEMDKGTAEKRVGLTVNGRAPVREGVELVDDSGNSIGRVTSGGFGPSLDAPIAMGYVGTSYSAQGTQIHAMVRGKAHPVTVSSLPFVPHNYVR